MSLQPDIILQNWVFEKDVVEAFVHASETKKNLTVLMQSSPKDIIRDATKKSLLETIHRDFQLIETISYTFTTLMDTTKNNLWKILFHFRSWYFGYDEQEDNKQFQKAWCYERSVAYMIAWRHRAEARQNDELAQEMAEALSIYLGDKQLASVYLNDPLMKEDALRYFASLKKPTAIKTADIIPYRIVDWTVQILLWTRDHFPTGTATLGGFVDFKRKHDKTIPSDTEIAETYDIPDITIVTALREWVEEMWREVADLVHTRKYWKTEKWVYWIEQWDMRLEIDVTEQIIDNTFVEDPETMKKPTDPRGLVTSIFYIARLVSWTPTWSDDVGEVKRVDLDSIDDQHFAMHHHKEFLEKMRNEKRDR
jgi:hypothetical protein